MIGLRPMCDACIHIQDGYGWRCAAFPNGIPASILDGADHRTQIDGDNGIQFQQNPASEPFQFRTA